MSGPHDGRWLSHPRRNTAQANCIPKVLVRSVKFRCDGAEKTTPASLVRGIFLLLSVDVFFKVIRKIVFGG